MPKKSTATVIKGPRKVSSVLTELRWAEARLQALDAITHRATQESTRLAAYNPNIVPAKILRDLEKEKEKARKIYTTQRKKYSKIKKLPYPHSFHRYDKDFIETLRWWDTAAAICPTLEGVATTRFVVPEVLIESPSQNDTVWEYRATSYDAPSGSFYSLMFDHWLQDKTHWYSFDTLDLMWVISHFGFEFPAPACDGTLFYEAEIRLIVSTFVNAESSGFLLLDLMLDEQTEAGTPPPTVEAYTSRIAQRTFATTDFSSDRFSLAGSFPVKKNKKSRLWFGVGSLVSAKEGIAGTNGWSYLMVNPPAGIDQPGIKYTIVPS